MKQNWELLIIPGDGYMLLINSLHIRITEIFQNRLYHKKGSNNKNSQNIDFNISRHTYNVQIQT